MLDSYAIAVQGLGFGRLLLAIEGLLPLPEVALERPVFSRSIDADTFRVGAVEPSVGARRVGVGSPSLGIRRVGEPSL